MERKLKMGLITASFVLAGAANAAFKAGDPYPNMIVPYVLGADLSAEARAAFIDATDYLMDNTRVQFQNISSGPIPPDPRSYIEVHQQTGTCTSVGIGRGNENGLASVFVGYPSLTIGIDSSCPKPGRGIMLHELLHVLGFLHEQSRPDARKYLEFNEDIIRAQYFGNDLLNYLPFKIPLFYPQNFGPYDYDSVTHYTYPEYYASRTPVTTNATSIPDEGQNAFVTYLKETGEGRFFRIMQSDSTKYFSFDNKLWLNILNIPAASPYPTSLTVSVSEIVGDNRWAASGAQFSFEYSGTGSNFYLKHRLTNKYLAATPTNRYSAWSLSSSKFLWKLENSNDGESYKIRDVSTGLYLTNYAGAASLNTNGTDWLIKLVRQEPFKYGPAAAPNSISIMDNVSLHWRYGFPFRLKTKDSTPWLGDNPTLHAQNYGQVTNQLHTAPGQLRIDSEPNTNLGWWSSQWKLERVSTYGLDFNSSPSNWVKIRNVWNGGYLNTENNGQVQLHARDTLDDLGNALIGVNLNNDWTSADWEMVIGSDYFLLKNRKSGAYLYNNNGILGVGTEINSAYKWSFQPIERERHNFNLPCNWCL